MVRRSTSGIEDTVSHAYGIRKNEARQFNGRAFKIGLVCMDCIFLGAQPVLVHMSKNKLGTYSFDPVSVNFLVEFVKMLYALIILLIVGTGRPGSPMYLSPRSFLRDARHNGLLAIPAALYAVNNSLKFTMQLFFKPTTTKMLGNLKVFTIALLMRVVMKRRFNVIQWEALFLLVAGITINQLRSCSSGSASDDVPSLLFASLCTLGTVTVPSAASVYNEFALKKHMDTSVHLQNFFLYFYGACFNGAFLVAVSVWKGQPLTAMFAGQSAVTAALVANNAAQGILSSFFYKFADTILKKYSSTIATIFTAVMSFAMFGHELSANFLVGVSIVLVSMHQFFTFGDKQPKGPSESTGKMVYSPSLDHIALASAAAASEAPSGARRENDDDDGKVLPR